MLGIDESRYTTTLLNLSDGMQRQRCLTRTLRAIDLNDTALGVTATEGKIKREGTGGDGFHPHAGSVTKTHDRSLAEIALDLTEHQIQRLVTLTGTPLGGAWIGTGSRGFHLCRHGHVLKLRNERSNATEAPNRLK